MALGVFESLINGLHTMTDPTATPIGPMIRDAQMVVPCPDIAASLAFFTERLGFRVEQIHPADAPTVAVISGFGVHLRLQAMSTESALASPMSLRLACDFERLPAGVARALRSPCGVQITLADADPPLLVPAGTQEFLVCRHDDANAWGVGRAGMQYRDLIPGRLGGRFIASHIRIPDGGVVPDYVHYHKVRFQMIFCKAGWVRVVFEDQGPSFVLQAGDCVLQPPQIRHRVLEASPGLEVIELGCPAIHETFADHQMSLPTAQITADRRFYGQRFVHHVAAQAPWRPWRLAGLMARDSGIAGATEDLATVRVVRVDPSRPANASALQPSLRHSGELLFLFVLRGQLALHSPEFGEHCLRADDACVIPADTDIAFAPSTDLEFLEVALPA